MPSNETGRLVSQGRDYAFDIASRFPRDYRTYAAEIKSHNYRPIGESFARSLNKIVHLGNMPVDLSALVFGIGELYGQISHVHKEEFKSGRITSSGLVNKAWEAWLEIYMPRIMDDPTGPHQAWGLGSQLIIDLVKALQHPDAIAAMPRESEGYFLDGIESILSAMLSNAYVAFESMAADLWVEALDSNPAYAKRWLEKNPERQIKLLDIIGGGTDLTNRLGSILKQTRKVNFISLNDIKNNYKAAFGDDIVSIFDGDGNHIVAVEQMRHLYAHTGGIIDREFIDKSGAFPWAKNISVGQPYPIDGHIVCASVTSCINVGFGLLRFVDGLDADKP
ncbi:MULTISPECIES: hypothetical protein [unclassified Methylobacterium]|uniref:hypothetical protein n=1 Tax=unclassified Methylobacterium TaxID=2615210 RepID=UPI0008EA3446|nr:MULTISPECIES: hypothetical protein [unclassified Methylobacterium]SFV11652.1 hypothetical protein SAMN02799643_05523 [Methylobacterium sp. UNCCL125]